MSLVIKKSVAEGLNALGAMYNQFSQWVQTRFVMLQKGFSIDLTEHDKRLRVIEEKLGLTYTPLTDEEINKMVQDELRRVAGLPTAPPQGSTEEVPEEAKPVELVDKKREHIEF